jgi:hypothetical protein
MGAALGPTVPSGWVLVGTTEFNGDGCPDSLLYNAATRQTVIWYLQRQLLYRLRVWSNRLEIDRAVSDLLDVRSGGIAEASKPDRSLRCSDTSSS